METKQTKTPSDIKSLIGQIETQCDLYLVKKAPFAIPENIKEIIVKYGPYISVVLIIIAFPAIIATLGLSSALSSLGFLARGGFSLFSVLAGLFMLASLILEIMALPGLFKRAASSWRLMFYSTLLSAINSLLMLDIGGLIIGTLLSLYVLFQIKSYYR